MGAYGGNDKIRYLQVRLSVDDRQHAGAGVVSGHLVTARGEGVMRPVILARVSGHVAAIVGDDVRVIILRIGAGAANSLRNSESRRLGIARSAGERHRVAVGILSRKDRLTGIEGRI